MSLGPLSLEVQTSKVCIATAGGTALKVWNADRVGVSAFDSRAVSSRVGHRANVGQNYVRGICDFHESCRLLSVPYRRSEKCALCGGGPDAPQAGCTSYSTFPSQGWRLRRLRWAVAFSRRAVKLVAAP